VSENRAGLKKLGEVVLFGVLLCYR
jgi:hypothetical protein